MSEQYPGYVFPAWFINTVIAAILAALLSIAGYMVIWNSADAAFKAQVSERLAVMSDRLGELTGRVNGTLATLPATQQQVIDMERRLGRVENRSENREPRK